MKMSDVRDDERFGMYTVIVILYSGEVEDGGDQDNGSGGN